MRCAFWLGFALMQRGEMAQGGGWLARAGRMVEEHELDTVERGYLLVPAGLMAMDAGESDTALERFAEADSLARRFGDPDLATLGTLGQGEALLRMGRMSEGLRLFDEAMVAVTAGETSPMISGLVYCAVIDRCQHVFDLRRAREWTAALDRWCEQQPGLVPYRGQCLVHRAQVLQVRGDWTAAVAAAEQARQRLSDPPHPAVGMAYYQLGELHRLRGELPQAEDAYRQAHAAGREPQPGLALLRLAEGRSETAATAIESALDAAGDRMSRARLLPAYAEVMLAAGRTDDARTAADELDELAESEGATMLGAIADQTRGALLLAGGEPRAALGPMRAALDAWQELDAPYEAAQVRVLLAGACRQLDDHDRAELECDVAREVFEQLGAAPALAQLDRLLAGADRVLRVVQSGSGRHRPGASGAPPGGRRAHQPRNRGRAGDQREDRRAPSGQHLHEARRVEPHGRHRPRLRPRPVVEQPRRPARRRVRVLPHGDPHEVGGTSGSRPGGLVRTLLLSANEEEPMTTRPITSQFEKYAASSAENYERHFVPAIGEPVARRLVEAARPAAGERVLDIACGTGIVTRLATEAVGPDGTVTGLDANPGMLEVARTVSPDGIDWHEAPAEDMPLPDATFDLVLCSMGLQFFADKSQALREMRRVLASDGRAVWCTPGPIPPLFEAIDQALTRHIGPGASMFVHAVFSLHVADEARALMETAGFDRVEVETTSVPLRVAPPADFFWQYVQSTPLAAVAAELDERARVALEAEVVERCAAFVDGDGSVMEPGLLIVTGTRQVR